MRPFLAASLHRLDLEGTKWSRLHGLARGLSNLKYLDVSDMNLVNLNGELDGLGQVESFMIDGNRLTYDAIKDAFHDLTKAHKWMNFGQGRNAFEKFGKSLLPLKVGYFVMEDIGLKVLNFDEFPASLNYIRASNNPITDIVNLDNPNTIGGWFVVANCDIRKINLTSAQMRIILLNKNKITQFEARNTLLEYLDLGFNQLTILEPKMFWNSNRLDYLSLANNHIRTIEKNTFQGMKNLENLYLNNNLLTDIDRTILQDLPLETMALNLEGNLMNETTREKIVRFFVVERGFVVSASDVASVGSVSVQTTMSHADGGTVVV
jgi:Leucine-rich repeat (LRR) protein